MKRLALTFMLAALAALTVLAFSGLLSGATARPVSDRADAGWMPSFEKFLDRYEAANQAFVNGNPHPWLAITAEKDPASIFGGFGGLGEAGITTVHERYRRAAAAFQPSGAEVAFQYLVKDVRGRLAYTVAIERADVLYAGQTERRPQVLRATMIFRLDRGSWKIVHRHADTMVELQLPR
jgi:hypothetical protein